MKIFDIPQLDMADEMVDDMEPGGNNKCSRGRGFDNTCTSGT